MRCTAHCTASSYDINNLHSCIKQYGITTRYRDNFHLKIAENQADVFYFFYGVTVFWGLEKKQEDLFLEKLKPFEIEPGSIKEYEEFQYQEGDTLSFNRDGITLIDKDPVKKLAISYGLSQSVKLDIFEILTEQTISNTRSYPKDLALKGKISLSRKEISQKIGQLFMQRNSINLHTEILDTPEFFWQNPELEHLYITTAKSLDIPTRTDILNKRLNMIKELFEILSEELKHQHSSSLEWIIIWLIVIEVIITLLTEVFKLL